MLKGIDKALSAELVYVLMLMGHGGRSRHLRHQPPGSDHRQKNTFGKLIDLTGCDIPRATTAILSLMTLDTFVDTPVMRMQVVGNPNGIVPIFARMQQAVDAAEGRSRGFSSLASSTFDAFSYDIAA